MRRPPSLSTMSRLGSGTVRVQILAELCGENCLLSERVFSTDTSPSRPSSYSAGLSSLRHLSMLAVRTVHPYLSFLSKEHSNLN